MSIQNIRIIVENAAPLDGSTPLSAEDISNVEYLDDGTIEVTVPTLPFGKFNPGQLTKQLDLNFILANITVVSEGAAVHVDGDKVGIQSPNRLPSGLGNSRTIIDLAVAESGSGIIGTANEVIPTDHDLLFSTVTAGPHVIQMTLVPVPEDYIEHIPTSSGDGDGDGDGDGCPNEVIVQSESDFPAAVANVITLADDTVYNICGIVTLTDNNYIVYGNNSVLQGADRNIDGLAGNTPGGPLVRSGPGSNVVFKGLQISNGFAGGFLFEGTNSATPTETCHISDCRFFNGVPGIIRWMGTASVENNIFDNAFNGVTFDNTVSRINVEENTFQNTSGSGQDIQFTSTFRGDICTIHDNYFLNTSYGGDPPGGPIRRNAGATASLMTVRENWILHSVPFIGFDQTTIGTWMHNNWGYTGLVDSTRVGGMSFALTGRGQDTQITTAGVYVRIGNGNAIHPLFVADGFNERFSLVGTETQNQALQYDGEQPFTGIISVHIPSPMMPLGGPADYAIRLVHLPSGGPANIIANTTVKAAFDGTSVNGHSISWDVPYRITKDDQFYIEVANLDNTNNLEFLAARLTIKPGSR